MDLKNWKITSADGKKATLTHKDGHFMSIAIKSLSKMQQQQLQRLSGGGAVKGINTSYTPKGGTSKAGMLVAANQPGDMDLAKNHIKRAISQNRADKGDKRNLADGGAIGTPPPIPDPDPIESQPTDILGDGRQNFEDGTPDEPVQADDNGMLNSDQTLNTPNVVSQQQNAIQQAADVEGAKARGMIAPETEMIAKQQDIAQQQQDHYNELKSHTDAYNDYIQNHPIDARSYAQSMTSRQRTYTALGLLLGGMAGQGHGNTAMDFLNNQMNRDIDAQKTNAQNQHTVWGAYHDLYGDSNIATNLAKVSANDILTHKANLVAAQLGTPQAQATANMLKAQKGIENRQILINTAAMRGNLQTGGGNSQQSTGTQTPEGQPDGPEQPGQQQMPVTPPGGSSMILHKGADQGFQGFLYGAEGNPAMQQLVPELTDQYSKARQAEKSLKTVDQVFPALTREANFGQWVSGHLPSVSSAGSAAGGALIDHVMTAGGGAAKAAALGTAAASFAPEALAGLGLAAAGAGASGLAQKGWESAWDKTNQTRQYLSDKSQLYGAVSSALKGINIAPHKVEELVEANSPTWKDSPKTIEKKARTVKDFIKSHLSTSMLKLKGLTDE